MSINAVTLAYGKPEDPDAQATITDYLDYTEYLPADLHRALSLIGKLDEDYLERANTVHELSKRYGELPHLSSPSVDPQMLRSELSYNLELAVKAREASLGEAERMSEMISRYHSRLTGIQSKLSALPKPPSRDPTPVARSPPTSRKTPARIHLRLEGSRPPATTGRKSEKDRKKGNRNRRITIPGEVLPPPNPDSPQEFTDSDWESIPPSPLPMPTARVGGSRSRSHKPSRVRPPKLLKTPKDRPPRVPREPGMGTNVHSQVAGISTSNALSLLPKPPADAEMGSEHAPWMRLTEYEMALLRKRMKKNAIWTPSETMIRRELAAAGRGPDAYRKRKAECDEKDEEFLDEDNVAESSPNRPLVPGEIRAESLGIASENLSNRGMKLNEAKKQKRELQLERTRQETREAQRNLDNLGPVFKDLFKKPGSLESPRTPLFPTVNGFLHPERSAEQISKSKKKTPRKRPIERYDNKTTESQSQKKPARVPARAHEQVNRMDSADTAGASGRSLDPPPKRRKTDVSTSSASSTKLVPLAPPGPSALEGKAQDASASVSINSASATKRSKTSSTPSKSEVVTSRPRRISLTLRGPAHPQEVSHDTRTPSQRTGRRGTTAASPTISVRERPLRGSSTPATPAQVLTPMTPDALSTATSASRRSRRPAGGKNAQEDHEVDSEPIGLRERSTRKERPALMPTKFNSAKKKMVSKSKLVGKIDLALMELPDPDEPRYCICGDVSWGEMVACENEHCKGEWFHYTCVELTEAPPRRAKWYCPPCKVKLKLTE